MERLGLTGAKAQVLVGWKEIYAVVERFPCIGIRNGISGGFSMVRKILPVDF